MAVLAPPFGRTDNHHNDPNLTRRTLAVQSQFVSHPGARLFTRFTQHSPLLPELVALVIDYAVDHTDEAIFDWVQSIKTWPALT